MTVYGVALNFKDLLDSLGDSLNHDPYKKPPHAPILYIKPANTVIGYGDPIPCPPGTEKLRMGGTLGVVIGTTACRVNEEDAMNSIAGYTIVNDVSIPHDSYYRPAIRQKCRDGFCPLGPHVVQASAIPTPDQLPIEIRINGVLRATSNTADLVRRVGRLIADVSDFLTLKAGDILLVGEPGNAPHAGPGDRVSITIEGIGTLENSVERGR